MIAADGTAEERLLVLASLTSPTVGERTELAALTHGRIDWYELARLAQLNATTPLLYRQLNRARLLATVPVDVRHELAQVATAVGTVNDRRLTAATALLNRFQRADIDCVILKGMLFGLEIYGDVRYKRMNDIDILIRVEDAPAALEIYRQSGMFSSRDLMGKQAKVKPQRTHHLPSFATADGALVVGTHWGLITPRAPYTLDYEAIWSRVRRIDFYGAAAWAMADEDNLHHLCIHLPYYKTGVRELADIWNLMRDRANLDIELVVDEMRKAGTQNLVFHALSLTNRLVPHQHSESLIEAAAPAVDRWYRYDVARKIRDIHILLRSRSTHTSRIEKAYTHFNVTERLDEKAAAFVTLWAELLAPPAHEAAKMSSLRATTPVSRVVSTISAPYRLIKVFQRDLGQWLFFAALIKTVLDLGGAAVDTVFRPNHHRDSLVDFAARVGVTTDDLSAILEGQE